MNQKEQVMEMLETCRTYKECVDKNIYLSHKYRKLILTTIRDRNIELFKKEHCVLDKNNEIVSINRTIAYIYGNTGCGKSYGVYAKYGNNRVFSPWYSKPVDYDGYQYEPVILLDNFFGDVSIKECLKLFNNTSLIYLKCRCHTEPNLASKIILVSLYPFDKLYPKKQNTEDYKLFKSKFNGGIWEMYQAQDGKRYIAEVTDDINELSTKELPIANRGVSLVTYKELLDIKRSCMDINANNM